MYCKARAELVYFRHLNKISIGWLIAFSNETTFVRCLAVLRFAVSSDMN